MTDSDPAQLEKMVESTTADEKAVLLAAFDAILTNAPAYLQFIS